MMCFFIEIQATVGRQGVLMSRLLAVPQSRPKLSLSPRSLLTVTAKLVPLRWSLGVHSTVFVKSV